MSYHNSGMPTMEIIIALKKSPLFSPDLSLYFSTLSSSQILFSGCMATAVVVHTFKMMDQVEEVALELSRLVGGYEGIFALSGVSVFPLKRGEGWLVLSIFVLG